MKIEKLNDRQLRVTLTREDLEQRKIRLSELAYGSEKARNLFREMMQMAMEDYDFEIENTPLMVEAIPLSGDSIILIVTKVDDPEELDSRYARFSSEDGTGKYASEAASATLSGADDILDLISRLRKVHQEAAKAKNEQMEDAPKSAGKDTAAHTPASEEPDEADIFHLTRFFLFKDLEMVIRAVKMCDPSWPGISSLFKNPEDGNYYLILQKGESTPEMFNKICNILSEFAMQVDYAQGMTQFFSEHMVVLLEKNAMASLQALSR